MRAIIDRHRAGENLSHIRATINKERSLLNVTITFEGDEFVGVIQKVEEGC